MSRQGNRIDRYDDEVERAAPSSERFCIACRHSLRGIASRKCPECGRAFDPTNPRTTSAYSHSDFVEFVRSTSRLLIILSGWVTIFAFLYSATAFSLEPFGGPLWLYACGLPLLPVLLIAAVAAHLPATRLSRRLRVWAMALPILYVSIGLTNWPLRLNLAVHKPWLDKVADRVQAAGTINRPGFVGLIRYRQVRLIPEGNVGFQLSGGAGGGGYLVRAAPTATRVWYNTNWEISLGDNWYLAFED